MITKTKQERYIVSARDARKCNLRFDISVDLDKNNAIEFLQKLIDEINSCTGFKHPLKNPRIRKAKAERVVIWCDESKSYSSFYKYK